MVKVSIIVPCFKVEKYIDRCMESIVSQTLKDIEIILIDDLSPDSTPGKCDEWAKKDSRIIVIHKKENEGLGFARNTGLQYAHGEYVAFLDSDDWFEQDMMERLYNECIKENLDVIYSEFNVDEYPGYRVVLRPEHLYEGKDEIEQLMLDIVGAEPSYISGVKFQCSACKGLYRKKLIDKYKLHFLSEREYISEDSLFNLNVLYFAEKVKTVPWQFYHYCLNNASLTHTYRPDRWGKLLKMLDVMETSVKISNKKELRLRLTRTAIFYSMSAIMNEIRNPESTKNQALDGIKAICNNEKLCAFMKDYPIHRLPLKWIVFTLALKLKLSRLLYNTLGGGREKLRLKYVLSLIPPISWYLAIKERINDRKLYQKRVPYLPQIRKLITPDTSIISSNCFAGRIMQDLGMQYNTPTLGLYFFADDYIEFLSNLKYYLTEAKLEFLDESRYPLGNERRAKWTHWYPIGLLGGKVEIQFLHYHTEKEAAEKWYRRARRVNFDKLFVIGMEQNLCTIDNIKAFDKLPFEKKIFFSTKQIEGCSSNCYLHQFVDNGEVGDPYKRAQDFYRTIIEQFL